MFMLIANGPNLNASGYDPMVSFTFGVHCGVPFSLHAGKGKCCMWLLIKWKFILQK